MLVRWLYELLLQSHPETRWCNDADENERAVNKHKEKQKQRKLVRIVNVPLNVKGILKLCKHEGII